jgi:hypothetical protein
MLSLITSPENVEIELGSKVPDAASGTSRDVDITITSRNPDGLVSAYAGVEVKDEGEPLGTQTVEQLISKLSDMPSITRKAIVSSSGNTAPAKSKAKYHGVELLTLREWRPGERVYSFLSPHFSAAVEINLNGWVHPPDVTVVSDGGPVDGFPASTEVVENGAKTTLGKLIDRVVAQELSRMTHAGELRDLAHGYGRHLQQQLLIKPPLTVTHDGEPVRIIAFQIEGDVFAYRKREAPAMKLLVNDETGEPHAACLVGLMPTNDLWGAVFTSADINPHMVRIPVSDRNLGAITRLRLPKRNEGSVRTSDGSVVRSRQD